MEGFVGHDRILVVLAVILAKDTLFDRTASDRLQPNHSLYRATGARERVAISTFLACTRTISGRSVVRQNCFGQSLSELLLIYVCLLFFSEKQSPPNLLVFELYWYNITQRIRHFFFPLADRDFAIFREPACS
ncbi:hypothetical protein [Microcoleus sp. B4-D4]|uniref:hypothetical protein n=1 Tax=Microcoleus sp. B4-D4 TaxID=2818667 RepID=UPI002FD1279E